MRFKNIAHLTVMTFLSALAPAFAHDVLTALDGMAGAQTIQLEAAKAGAYMAGFTRAGDEFVCAVPDAKVKKCGVMWHVPLNQKVPAPVRITGEGKVEAGDGSGEVLLYVDVAYCDGGHLWGQKGVFSSMPCDWRKRSVTLMSGKPIKTLSIYMMARKDKSLRTRFRAPVVDVFNTAEGVATFDGIPVKMEKELDSPAFLLRDARAGGGFAQMSKEAKGVRIGVKEEMRGVARFFNVDLLDLQGGDRALTLVWTMPVRGSRLVWFNSPRSEQDVSASSSDFREVRPVPCGAGAYSPWPILAASVDGKGVAIGFDPRCPAFSRLSLQAGLRLMYAAFDVALVPEKKSAHFGFVTFPFEARDGFRGALEAYQRLFPEHNEVKQTKQGNWMAFRPISKVEGWEDFGFAIKEGDGETAWDDAHGITTYFYTEPTTWWMPIKGRDGRSSATMQECIAEAERLASLKKGGGYARALKRCGFRDEDGHMCGRILDTPWCNGIVWNMNCAPGQGPDGEFAAKLGDEHFAKKYKGSFPDGLDGEYVDSSEMYVTAPLDYNRANFAGMDTPLVFSSSDFRPCVFKGMMGYEYVRGAWRKVRAIGRRMMANATPHNWWWLAPYLDVLGTETNWHPGDKWTPWPDAKFMYARSICGAKPFCFLMNTDFNTFTYELVDKYMQRALAYGMYPSFFSPAATSKSHYFTKPDYYNRDRPLFKKYMPLCKRVGEAGWRPVNRLLSSDSADVITEQFGDSYATVFNLSAKPVRVTLTSLSGAPNAKELVSGGEWKFEGGRRTVEIPGETVFVLDFGNVSRKSELSLWLGRGGMWRTSAGVAVFNPTDSAWDGVPASVKVGGGMDELPVAGVRVEELRLVDDKGTELEYGVWSPDGKTLITSGQVPQGAEIVVPATCPARGVASMRIYWDNSSAWGLADFWKKRPDAKAPRPVVRTTPPTGTDIHEEPASSAWVAGEGGKPWAYRMPVRVLNSSSSPMKGAFASLPMASARRMLKNPTLRVVGPDGTPKPVFRAGGRVFFMVDVPPMTLRTFHLYARDGGQERMRVQRSAVSTLASEIPSDQVVIDDTGMTKADEEALRRLLESSSNMVKNASFEEPDEQESAWSRNSATAKGVVFSRPKGGLFGSSCAQLEVAPESKASWAGRVQKIGVKPGRTYIYGAFVSGERLSTNVQVHEHLHDAAGKTIGMGATESLKGGGGGWTPLFGIVNSGANGRSVTIHLTMNGSGIIRHDGVILVECAEACVGDPETSAAEQGSFAVRQFDVVEKVFKESSVEDSKGPFSIDLALNETEELQLAVRSGRRMARLEADVKALVGPGGASLPVAVGYVDWVPVDHPTAYYSCATPEWVLRKPNGSGQCDGWSGWWPDPIVPLGACELPANTARAFRFSVKTGAKTPLGVYAGEIVWREDGREIRRDMMSARVWNVSMPERPSFAAIYDVRLGNAAWRQLGGRGAAYERILSFMAEKKISPDRVSANPVFKMGKDGLVTADFAAYDKAAETYFNRYRFPVSYMPDVFYCFGWGHPPRQFLGIAPYEGKYPYEDVDRSKLSPRWAKAYKEALSLYWNHVKEKGWADRLVLYISDEPYMKSAGIVEQMKSICVLIHEVDPSIRIYVSTWRHLADWEDSIDVWGVAHYGAFPVDVMKRMRSAGRHFWFTTDGQECLDTVNCSTERLFPHFCAAWGVDAYEFWGCTWLTYDPWKFGWHSYIRQAGTPGAEKWVRYPAGDGYLIYPPRKGVVDDVCSSLRLEAARDGVEDYSLLEMLAARKDEAAAGLLAEFRALCPIPNSGGRYSGRALPDTSRLAALRRRALALLGGER